MWLYNAVLLCEFIVLFNRFYDIRMDTITIIMRVLNPDIYVAKMSSTPCRQDKGVLMLQLSWAKSLVIYSVRGIPPT